MGSVGVESIRKLIMVSIYESFQKRGELENDSNCVLKCLDREYEG